MSDRYSIVPGDPGAHRADVIALLGSNFESLASELRFAKYYERNPAGTPRFWLARDAESRAFVGMATLFPTTLRVGGEPVAAAVSGDFAVDEGHRGFGPALALQRAALAALPENGWACAFGCPNESSDPVIARVGFADVGGLSRYVKVLTAGRVLERRVRPRGLARIASGLSGIAVDPALALLSRERRHRRPDGLVVEKPSAFDERFARVWEAVAREHPVVAERSAELLNWKYELDSAEGPFEVLALLCAPDTVAGYAVHRVEDGARDVVDIAYLPPRENLDALLGELVRDARREGAGAISLYHLGADPPLTRSLRAFGFRSRPERTRLRVYVPEGAGRDLGLQDAARWHFLSGDTDL